MKPRRVMDSLDVLMAIFDDEVDWKDPWQHVVWCGLIVARQTAVGAHYKKHPSGDGLTRLRLEYELATRRPRTCARCETQFFMRNNNHKYCTSRCMTADGRARNKKREPVNQ